MASKKTSSTVQFSLLCSIIFILSFTPLGFIHLGFIKATIIQIPVIIGSIILGPKKGAMLGLVFGITSLINNTIFPVVSSFAFSPLIPIPGTTSGSLLALIVCFVPRILVGIVPYYLSKHLSDKKISLFICGVVGALINTILVMTLIYILFKGSYATINGVNIDVVYKLIVSIIFINGLPEALISGLVVAKLCYVLKPKYRVVYAT